jgi:GNAT superfamily N-acetyltransferase
MEENLQRMIKLAEEFFETKNDPTQISVTEEVMERLRKIHPSTMNQRRNEKGPIAWILVIPTTRALMEEFIAKKINEQGLLEKTPLAAHYEAIYLCSALVLPEHRRKGLAKNLLSEAVKSIQKQHPIRSLFYWGFSVEGEKLAAAVATELGLPLLQRPPDGDSAK